MMLGDTYLPLLDLFCSVTCHPEEFPGCFLSPLSGFSGSSCACSQPSHPSSASMLGVVAHVWWVPSQITCFMSGGCGASAPSGWWGAWEQLWPLKGRSLARECPIIVPSDPDTPATVPLNLAVPKEADQESSGPPWMPTGSPHMCVSSDSQWFLEKFLTLMFIHRQ